MKFYLPNFDQLTSEMKTAVSFPLSKNLLVVGAPGTGKSVIVLHRYKKLIEQGLKVKVICYNRLLNELLLSEIGEKDCKTINSFRGKIKFAVEGNIGDNNHGFIGQTPVGIIESVFEKYVEQYGKYDALLIDEGQDLSGEIINSLRILTDHISIFADPNQPLKDPSSDLSIIKNCLEPFEILLSRNFRNTKQIYEFAAKTFMKGDELANNPNLTRLSADIPGSTPDRHRDIIELPEQYKIIKDNILTCKEIGLSCGVFVSNSSYIEKISTLLKQDNIEHGVYFSGLKSELEQIIITTFLSAKGLEFDVVIVVADEGLKGSERLNEKFCVLSTRAKRKLIFIFEF